MTLSNTEISFQILFSAKLISLSQPISFSLAHRLSADETGASPPSSSTTGQRCSSRYPSDQPLPSHRRATTPFAVALEPHFRLAAFSLRREASAIPSCRNHRRTEATATTSQPRRVAPISARAPPLAHPCLNRSAAISTPLRSKPPVALSLSFRPPLPKRLLQPSAAITAATVNLPFSHRHPFSGEAVGRIAAAYNFGEPKRRR